jgi:hypothetical protein
MISNQPYKWLMSEYKKTDDMGASAMKADIHRQTASKYIAAGKPPGELQEKHEWRTRADPLEKIWSQAATMLRDAPELEAKALFEHFLAQPESGLEERHLRTFQRRVRHWQATEGSEQEMYFAQDRVPGQLMELDWTHAKALAVTIQGQALDHLFCHCVLPYSNWQWATRCLSESFLSLVSGLQNALAQLGKSPECLGTDNSSTATHELECLPERGGRGFNADYLELCTHYDLTPLTINIRCPNEHGDVESANRHLKRRLDQRLILRGSREFDSLEQYDVFVEGVIQAANAKRAKPLAEELARMRVLPGGKLAEYREYEPVVSSHSLIRVNKHVYSVPTRLIGHTLRVEYYESQLKVYLGREHLFDLPRLRGDSGGLVDFRHVIGQLVRKPGAFANYRHREALYPGTVFRSAHDRLVSDHGVRQGVIEYLQVLKLAAEESVEKVESPLRLLLAQPGKWRAIQVREQVVPQAKKVIELSALTPSLSAYDALLEGEVAHVG